MHLIIMLPCGKNKDLSDKNKFWISMTVTQGLLVSDLSTGSRFMHLALNNMRMAFLDVHLSASNFSLFSASTKPWSGTVKSLSIGFRTDGHNHRGYHLFCVQQVQNFMVQYQLDIWS